MAQTTIFMTPEAQGPNAYEMEYVGACRLSEFKADLVFRVELHREQMRQALFCGLLNRDQKRGIAVVADPTTGGIVDVLHGAGPLGYLTRTPILPHEPVPFELRIQKFGKNFICSVHVFEECVMYPSFVSAQEEVLHAYVGCDVDCGATVTYQDALVSLQEPSAMFERKVA